jgi:hypothetical protein
MTIGGSELADQPVAAGLVRGTLCAKVGPLRARFAGELAEQFGSVASREEIAIAADRPASRSSMTGLIGAE